MSSFELSEYQKNIINYVKNENGNLLVNAKAGSGKTSTLLLISEELDKQNKKSLFLAFNKSIVQELDMKINSENCEVKTIHSTGLSFIRSYLYKLYRNNYELEIDDSKCREIIKALFMEHCHNNVVQANIETMGEEDIKDLENDLISELVTLMNFCRFFVVNYHIEDNVKYIMYSHCRELREYKSIGMNNYAKIIEMAIDKVKEMFENPDIDELTGKRKYIIDYTDMVYLPLYYNMYVPFSLRDKLDYVMVDEAQDLSILQQLFIKKLTNGRTRYIFVGDEKQAIYGFAGADTHSIDNIKNNFVLTELPLNICYRCPMNVIKIAQDIVPAIDWNHTREDGGGVVEFLKQDDFYRNLKPNDMILGRKNRDLVVIYKTLVLDKKISVQFKNKALVQAIVRDIKETIAEYIRRYNRHENIEVELYKYLEENNVPLNKKDRNKEQQKLVEEKVVEIVQERKKQNKKICKSNHSIDYLKICMEEYKTKGAYKYRPRQDDDLKGYYDTILSFIDEFEKNHNSYTVKTFIKYVEQFLTGTISKDTPILSTIHMMKGSEADTIYIWDYPDFPYKFGGMNEDNLRQEENLQYVAITRAKKELYLIDLNGEDEKDREANMESHIKVKELLDKKEPEMDTDNIKLDSKQTPQEIFNSIVHKNTNKVNKFNII